MCIVDSFLEFLLLGLFLVHRFTSPLIVRVLRPQVVLDGVPDLGMVGADEFSAACSHFPLWR